MTTRNINMSLDDYIQNKGIRRPRRDGKSPQKRDGAFFRQGGVGKPTGFQNRPRFNTNNNNNMGFNNNYNNNFAPPVRSIGQRATGKLTISNLEPEVTDEDVRDLFQEFGEMKKYAIHYDKTGRSLGVAEVVYINGSDAVKAKNRYHGVPLDGKPMKIEFEEHRGGASGISGRLGPIPNRFGMDNAGGGGGGGFNNRRFGRGFNNNRGFRGNQRFNQRRGGWDRREKKPEDNLNISDLDAELDAYRQQG